MNFRKDPYFLPSFIVTKFDLFLIGCIAGVSQNGKTLPVTEKRSLTRVK